MNNIINELILLKEESYSQFNKKLCPDTKLEILGIRVPILRKFAKRIIKSNEYDWEKFIKNKKVDFFEEVQLQGFIIGYSKFDFKYKIKLMEDFIPRMDSWSLIDTFVPTLRIDKKYLSEYWEFILKYIKSNEEFEVRFAIVSMLNYFITDEYVDDVINNLNEISHTGYYVKMAIAWTLAEIGIRYNDKLMKFLNRKNNLDLFTYNKTLQKMIESYRIENEYKDVLRKMKIRNKD